MNSLYIRMIGTKFMVVGPELSAQVSSNWRKRLNEVYSKHTGKMTKFNYM
jgi:hypothetical protein